MQEPKTIAIIGGTGKMGQMFSKAFGDKGYEVLVAGRTSEISIEEASSKGDVVIISVPIRNTKEMIERVVKSMKKDAMLTDFTSVKVIPCGVMKESFKGEVVGGHPVFGPVNEFKGKRFVLCKVREGSYYDWYKDFLESLGCEVFEMSADEHDKIMAIVQCMNHFSNFSTGYGMSKTDVSLKEVDKLASPNYNLRLYPIGRVLTQDANLYSDILTENPYSKEFNKKFVEASKELLEAIENNDKEKIENIINSTKEYFGELSEKSLEITNKILSGF